MAEKTHSPDPKTQSKDSKNLDAKSSAPTRSSPAGDEGTSGASKASSSDANAGVTSGLVSSETETSFQRLVDAGEIDALMTALEVEELEAPNGIPATIVYERLLAVYLLQNDFHNAKLLWKRIPGASKTPDSELYAIWAVGQKFAKSDYAGIYQALRRPWKTQQNLMRRVQEATRRRAVELVAKAYESISIENLQILLGASSNGETENLAREMHWAIEEGVVYPIPSTPLTRETGSKFLSRDDHLGLLTDYVSFLESH